MINLDTLEVKYFVRDVIGKVPTVKGEVFKAQFMGAIRSFRVTEMLDSGCFLAVLNS